MPVPPRNPSEFASHEAVAVELTKASASVTDRDTGILGHESGARPCPPHSQCRQNASMRLRVPCQGIAPRARPPRRRRSGQ